MLVESVHPNTSLTGDIWASPIALDSTELILSNFSGTSADWQYEEETLYCSS